MQASPMIKPTKDVVDAIKTKTDGLPADPATITAITAIKQKATSPAWDQDTDSLEAISERITAAAAVTSSGYIKEKYSTGYAQILNLISPATKDTFSGWLEYWDVTDEDLWICSVIGRFDSQYKCILVFEIGVGAAGSEVSKVRYTMPHYSLSTPAIGMIEPYIYTLPIPIYVASGSRVACRLSTSIDALSYFQLNIQFYGGL